MRYEGDRCEETWTKECVTHCATAGKSTGANGIVRVGASGAGYLPVLWSMGSWYTPLIAVYPPPAFSLSFSPASFQEHPLALAMFLSLSLYRSVCV